MAPGGGRDGSVGADDRVSTGRHWLISLLAIPVAVVWVPFLAFGAVVLLMAASLPVEAWDRLQDTNPLTPGRWEARDGEYWIQLDADGTGTMRLPGDIRFGGRDACLVAEGPIEWELELLTSSAYGVEGWLDVSWADGGYPPCEDFTPWIAPTGGYDWDRMLYAEIDIDSPLLHLDKVND